MRRARVAERRKEILETTCRVVLARGFAHTRIADVAAELGVSTGTIHYHFVSKDVLFAEALRYAADRDLDWLAASVARGTTALERVDRVLRSYLPDVDGSWVMWVDAWAQALRSPVMRAISEELDARWHAVLEGIIKEGVAGGEFTCPDPAAAAWRLTALLDGLALQVLVHSGIVGRRQMLDYARTAARLELGLPENAFPKPARSR